MRAWIRGGQGRTGRVGAICLAGTAVFWAAGVRAEDKPLPSGEEILDRLVEVTGGKEAYAKVTNRKITGTYDLGDQVHIASVLIYQARPNKRYSRYEFPQADFGLMESGTDGRNVWLRNKRGVFSSDDDQTPATLHEAFFDHVAEWRELYKKAECRGIEEVEGKPCYRVVLTPKTMPQLRTHFYDVESGLLVKTLRSSEDLEGDFQFETYYGEYKPVDGVLYPFRERRIVEEDVRVTILDSVEHNVELPDNIFAKPDSDAAPRSIGLSPKPVQAEPADSGAKDEKAGEKPESRQEEKPKSGEKPKTPEGGEPKPNQEPRPDKD